MADDKTREYDQAALKKVLATVEGRRVIGAVLETCNLLAPSYSAGDPLAMAHNEGMRSVGLWLKGAVDDIDPECFGTIYKERMM